MKEKGIQSELKWGGAICPGPCYPKERNKGSRESWQRDILRKGKKKEGTCLRGEGEGDKG